MAAKYEVDDPDTGDTITYLGQRPHRDGRVIVAPISNADGGHLLVYLFATDQRVDVRYYRADDGRIGGAYRI